MTVINTNIAASITANAMKSNQRTMENTMERLSTGKRINSAADAAAGLAIGSKMEAQIRDLCMFAFRSPGHMPGRAFCRRGCICGLSDCRNASR